MNNTQKLPEQLAPRERANGIYIEPPIIAYVRVSDVRANDWGVKALITVLPTPGMSDGNERLSEIRACWQTFSHSYDLGMPSA